MLFPTATPPWTLPHLARQMRASKPGSSSLATKFPMLAFDQREMWRIAQIDVAAAAKWPGLDRRPGLVAEANRRLEAALARAQASRPSGARGKSMQDMVDGLEARTAALRVERDRLVAQVAKVEADMSQTQRQAARACAAELERSRQEALAATPWLASAYNFLVEDCLREGMLKPGMSRSRPGDICCSGGLNLTQTFKRMSAGASPIGRYSRSLASMAI